jgi:uncharacterized phosphosugar-binding protein
MMGKLMVFAEYIVRLRALLERIEQDESLTIQQAGYLVADALAGGGIVHAFGTGHSHMIAEEAFYRAGGLAAVNPILDERLIFLKGALESTRAERESGLAGKLLEREDVRAGDVAIIISNSGRNAATVEMASEMRSRGVPVIAITNVTQSRASPSRHASGKRLFELADVVVDNHVPTGDAVLELPGLTTHLGPASTVAGTAIMHSIFIEAAAELLRRGVTPPVFQSANVEGHSEDVEHAEWGIRSAGILPALGPRASSPLSSLGTPVGCPHLRVNFPTKSSCHCVPHCAIISGTSRSHQLSPTATGRLRCHSAQFCSSWFLRS